MFLAKLKVAVCAVMVAALAVVPFAAGQQGSEGKAPPNNRPLGVPVAEPPSERVVGPRHPAVKDDLERLEGVWMASDGTLEGIVYVFGGDKCMIIDSLKKNAYEYRIDIDPTKSPKWLDLTGEHSPRPWTTIYELTGDTLRIVSRHEPTREGAQSLRQSQRLPRPTVFKDDAKAKVTVSTLKRIAPKTSSPAKYPPATMTEKPRLHVPYEEVPGQEAPKPPAPTTDADVLVLEAQLKVKLAYVNAAEVQLANAKKRYDLISPRAAAGQISRQELDQAKADVDNAVASLDIRRAELAEVEVKHRIAVAASTRKLGYGHDFEPKPTTPAPPTGPLLPSMRKPESGPRAIQTDSRTLTIPVAVDPAKRKELKELHLYVSADEGEVWQLVGKQPPEVETFRYVAPENGRYCFTLRMVKADGSVEPAALDVQLRVQVNSSTPAEPPPEVRRPD